MPEGLVLYSWSSGVKVCEGRTNFDSAPDQLGTI